MARIWPVYEGKNPTPGAPWVALPVREAIALFQLRRDDFVSGLSSTPRFGEVDRDLWFRGFKHVVVEIDEHEARQAGWKPGFYRARVAPAEAYRRLIEQPLVSALGPKNVIRVNYEPSIGPEGEAALNVTVVVTPSAIRRLKPDDTRRALDELRKRLAEMNEDSTPIVGYATELELAQDGGA